MSEAEILRQARKAIRRGDRETGQRLLNQALHINPRSEVAWLWLSAIVGSPDRERKCLERVLEINPRNTLARRHMKKFTQSRPATQKWVVLVAAAAVAIVLLVGTLLVYIAITSPTRTVPSVTVPVPVRTDTPVATLTDFPTWPAMWTVTATPTITPTRPPTSTPTPTKTRTPPATRTPLPTATAPCRCTGDLYDCQDFRTQAKAQECYDLCIRPGYGDIHRLDPDGNGRACESLP